MESLISIIIRTKNEELNVGNTLNRVFMQKIEVPFEVIIVDSGSTDNTLKIARDYNVKILSIPEDSFTFGYSLNYGITNSKGNIICALSAHCLPSDDFWLYRLTEPILNGECHATFGRQLPIDGLNPFEEFSLKKHFPEKQKESGRVPFSNANCAFLKNMWEEVRFDEHIPSWEDYLWYCLLKDKCKFRYIPEACVYHSHPFSIGRVKRIAYSDGMSFKYMKEKYNIDVFKESVPNSNRVGYLMKDMINQWKFMLKKRYLSFFLIFPIIRIISYVYCFKGYKRVCEKE